MLAPIIGWLTDLSLLRFDVHWFKNPDLRRLKSLRDSGIPEEDEVIIEGLHKRQFLAEDPSVTDLKYLEDAYKSKDKIMCYNYCDSKLFCFVQDPHNKRNLFSISCS